MDLLTEIDGCPHGPAQEAGLKLIRKPARPKQSPMLTIKLGNPKYASWKTFLDNAYWSVDLK